MTRTVRRFQAELPTSCEKTNEENSHSRIVHSFLFVVGRKKNTYVLRRNWVWFTPYQFLTTFIFTIKLFLHVDALYTLEALF